MRLLEKYLMLIEDLDEIDTRSLDADRRHSWKTRSRGRGRDRESIFRCFRCKKLGHRSFDYPKNDVIGQGSSHITQAKEGHVKAQK